MVKINVQQLNIHQFSIDPFCFADVNLELTCLALAYAISREKIPFVQSLLPTVRRIRPSLDLAKLFART